MKTSPHSPHPRRHLGDDRPGCSPASPKRKRTNPALTICPIRTIYYSLSDTIRSDPAIGSGGGENVSITLQDSWLFLRGLARLARFVSVGAVCGWLERRHSHAILSYRRAVDGRQGKMHFEKKRNTEKTGTPQERNGRVGTCARTHVAYLGSFIKTHNMCKVHVACVCTSGFRCGASSCVQAHLHFFFFALLVLPPNGHPSPPSILPPLC